MSLFGEFRVPGDAFALHATMQELPGIVIDIDRVVAAEDRLTPYFWISGGGPDEFAEATKDDPSIDDVRQLDVFEEAVLFRAEWTEDVEPLEYAYTNVGATILEAKGEADEWFLRMRFDDQEQLTDFQEYCNGEGISFELTQLHEIAYPRTGGQYGLSPKQHDALLTAWEMGYFDSPHRASLSEVADRLGVATSTLSERLSRAHHELIANTLTVTEPSEIGY